MPLIPPPSYNEPDDEQPIIEGTTMTPRYFRYCQWWANRPTWKCSVCGGINSESSESCNYCRGRLKKHTPRPAHIVVTKFEG